MVQNSLTIITVMELSLTNLVYTTVHNTVIIYMLMMKIMNVIVMKVIILQMIRKIDVGLIVIKLNSGCKKPQILVIVESLMVITLFLSLETLNLE